MQVDGGVRESAWKDASDIGSGASGKGDVLVVTQHAMVVGRLTRLIEKAGRTFAVPNPGEPPDDAITRLKPHAVLLDFDHASARTDAFFTYAAAAGTAVLLFSHAHYVDEVKRVSAARSVKNFVLPVDRTVFARLLDEAGRPEARGRSR